MTIPRSDLIARLREGAARHARGVQVTGGEVTCARALESKARGQWKDTTCAELHDGHRCHKVGGHSSAEHQCTCYVRWHDGMLSAGQRCGALDEIKPPSNDYCRQVSPEGHQCTWSKTAHGDGREHKCRGCRVRWS